LRSSRERLRRLTLMRAHTLHTLVAGLREANMNRTSQKILVTGATGFVGRALLAALVAAGYGVRATTRNVARSPAVTNVEWIRCDVTDPGDVERALAGVDAAYFLVHSMSSGRRDYADVERVVAQRFAEAAARAGLKRILYLGGVAPEGRPSKHLQSRLQVGEILRSGEVPALELRASMIVGNGSASWQIVRDLTMRLPAMILPAWTESRTCPVALEDVTVALVRALDLPLEQSAWFDIPGPEVLSAREMLLRVAALRGRRVPGLRMPFLSVSLSSWWLKLVARTDFALARQLVLGLSADLLPRDSRYWEAIEYEPRWTFDRAARQPLAEEEPESTLRGVFGRIGESMVQRLSPKLHGRHPSVPGKTATTGPFR
jgi:uncharacterized protein YbjT (DUF2867 family)